MVNIDSTSRLLSLDQKVILTQTDTTVGFLSQNGAKLANIKSRSPHKPFIKVFQDFKSFRKFGLRIPKRQKNRVRRMKRSTFIVKNDSFRIAPAALNSAILRAMEWSYSTSANESGKDFERSFCEQKADIIIEDKRGLYEESASNIYKINNKKTVRLR